MLWLYMTVLAILIILSAIFSGTETALMSVNTVRVRSLLRQKKKGSEALHRIKQNPHRLLITILIGNNLVNIGAASLATVVFTEMFGSSGVGIATGIMTFLILVFGEITPKTFSTQNATRVSLFMARPIEVMSYVFHPFVLFFEAISRSMSKILGSKKEKKLSEEELRVVVTMGKKEGLLSKEVADMMQNILDFEGTGVTSIMTPKFRMEMVDGNKNLKNVLNFVVKSPYSNFPVYINKRDNIVGVLDVDEVLKYVKNNKLGTKVKKLAKKIYFVPDSKKIEALLTEFEGKHIPMAIVVDEYGEVSGLVTVEDILEEIVGDIFDKSRRESIYIKKASDKLIRVDARASIEEINRQLHLGLREGHFNTLAGFIEHHLQKIPKKGEKIELKKVTLVVGKADKRGVKSVKIIRN
ncbi:MAG: HlyC/CorC family transporter [archaeon]|nr:MAG: HlyC/CorC family transporter [archaeon]